MYKNKKILVIIPARGGSKGVPKKNIKKFGGKPLMAWAIQKAKKIEYIDKIIVSTDDNKVAKIGKKYGADIPFIRDIKLAQDDTPMIDVIIDSVKRVKDNFDYALMLQANSPLSKLNDIKKVIQKIIDNSLDVVFTITEIQHPPQWTIELDKNAPKFAFLDDEGQEIIRRQNEKKLYRSTGAIFAVNTDYLLNNNDTVRLCLPANNQKTGIVITDEYSAIDIDTQLDFYVAETILKKGLNYEK